MPFDFPADPTVFTPPKTLEGLSFVLRHREMWPQGFVWDYTSCDHCAMGLAATLFANGNLGEACGFGMREIFGQWPGNSVSTNLAISLRKTMKEVTPEDVADAIDRYLDEAEGRS